MPLRQRGLHGRRLHLDSVPESHFVIEKCAFIADLVSAKRTALAHHDYTECINVFGALIAGHSEVSSCGADTDMIYAANILAETLDTNGDGSPDDAAVVDQIRSFGTTQPKAILVVGCNRVHEELESNQFDSHFEYAMSSQGHKHGESGHTHSGDDTGGHFDIRIILVEETFHWVHHWAWSRVYTPFSLAGDSALGRCNGGAQCAWWMHPENSGCSSLSGVKCSNPE